MSMTPRTALIVHGTLSAHLAIMVAIVSCHATFMKASQGV